MTALTSIPNIGPATAAAFRRAGITTAEELRALGADAAYAQLLAAGERPHFIAYYVLHMGLQGRPWNDCRGAEKDRLRARFDAIRATVAAEGPDPALDRFMRDFGLLDPADARASLAKRNPADRSIR